MMNLTKYGSPHLDTPSSRYEFLKFESLSEKEQRKTFKTKIAICTQLTTPTATDCWAP